MRLISVPGGAGAYGNNWSNGSLTRELQHGDRFMKTETDLDLAYGE